MHTLFTRPVFAPAFPKVRVDMDLSRTIEKLLLQAQRYPLRAEEFFVGSNLDTQTVARLLSGSKHRRPPTKKGYRQVKRTLP